MQVWEGKPAEDKMGLNGEGEGYKPDVASGLLKESNLSEKVDDHKPVENGSVTNAGDAPKGAKPVVAEKVVANGVVNGC